jgi:hypothetical protein
VTPHSIFSGVGQKNPKIDLGVLCPAPRTCKVRSSRHDSTFGFRRTDCEAIRRYNAATGLNPSQKFKNKLFSACSLHAYNGKVEK